MERSLKPPRKGIRLEHIILFFICLASMNMINRYFYFLFVALGLFCLRRESKVRFSPLPLITLLMLGLSMVVFSPATAFSVTGLIKPFTFLLCFFVGTGLVTDDRDEDPYKGFYRLVVAVALGLLIHYALNWLTNLSSDYRNTVDIWTDTVIAATGQAAIACIPLSLAIACLFIDCQKKYKVFAWIAIGIALMYNLILSGRTMFIIALVVVLVAFLYRLAEQGKNRMRTIVIALLIVGVVLILYQGNVFGIRSFVERSPFYERFFMEESTMELDEDGRMEHKLYYVRNAYLHLFGGSHMHEVVGYAHDIYLDTYDESGIFAFLGVTVYIIHAVWILIKLLKDKTVPFALRQIALCVSVGIHLVFWVEPILQGMPWLFASFCLLDGYMFSLVQRSAKKRLGR